MVDPFHGLAHPGRRQLLDELRDGPCRAGDLGEDLNMTREAVGKHLRVLEADGLVTVEQRGRERWYALNHRGLAALDAWLAPYRRFWSQRLDALDTEIARGQRAQRHHHQPSADGDASRHEQGA